MTLLNLLISPSNFLIVSLGFSIYNIMSSADSESFNYSFLIWIPFISFSTLIAIARTSKTMLNNSDENGHPCPVPDLRGSAFSFSTLGIMFAVGLSYVGEGNGNPLQYSCLENPMDGGAWYAAVHGVTKSWTRLSDFTFNFHFHSLEKEVATHSSALAWRIPGTREPGGLPSMGLHRDGHD